MDKKQFKKFIVERDGTHAISFESIIRQWQSANTLSENSVSVEVLEQTVRELYANKRKIQKNTKASN